MRLNALVCPDRDRSILHAAERILELLAAHPEGAATVLSMLQEERVAGAPGVSVDPETVQTNIVIFDLEPPAIDADELSRRLKERGVLANSVAPRRFRMVTHADVTREQCETAVEAVRDVLTRHQSRSR